MDGGGSVAHTAAAFAAVRAALAPRAQRRGGLHLLMVHSSAEHLIAHASQRHPALTKETAASMVTCSERSAIAEFAIFVWPPISL